MNGDGQQTLKTVASDQISTKKGEDVINCTICREVIISCGRNVWNHFKEKHELEVVRSEYNFLCYMCGLQFLHESVLNEHVSGHCRKTKRYKCVFCSGHFESSALLRDHRRVVHRGKYDACPVCGKLVFSGEHFVNHLVDHVNHELANIGSQQQPRPNYIGDDADTECPEVSSNDNEHANAHCKQILAGDEREKSEPGLPVLNTNASWTATTSVAMEITGKVSEGRKQKSAAEQIRERSQAGELLENDSKSNEDFSLGSNHPGILEYSEFHYELNNENARAVRVDGRIIWVWSIHVPP